VSFVTADGLAIQSVALAVGVQQDGVAVAEDLDGIDGVRPLGTILVRGDGQIFSQELAGEEQQQKADNRAHDVYLHP